MSPAPPIRSKVARANPGGKVGAGSTPWPILLAGVALLMGLVIAGYAAWSLTSARPGPEATADAANPPAMDAAAPEALPETLAATRPADPPEPTPAGNEPSEGANRLPPKRSPEQILSATEPGLRSARLDALPRTLVLDFPSLAEQGRALNRVAALIEKTGLPRDRVVSRAALDRYIAERDETPDTFYHGHNYGAADLARFFVLAERDGVRLDPAELRLRALLRETGALEPARGGGAGAGDIRYVITLARMEGADAPDLRRMILRHEIAHALYALRPAYRRHVGRFWEEEMTGAERSAFRRFLAERDYDAENPALVLDEMHAFLYFTPGPAQPDDAALGLPPGSVAALRRRFAPGVPAAFADLP